jgi:hypothetical protein
VSYEGFQTPVNSTPAGMYSWANNHVIQLRRILNDVGSGSTDLTAINAHLATIDAEIAALQAGGGTLTPQQQFELSLITASGAILGSLANVVNRVQTQLELQAEAVMRASIEAHRSSTGVRTQVSVTDGQATQITSVNAAIGVTNANVTAEQTARVSGDAALAANITSVSTTVAGNTANITTNTNSINGINASSTITLSLQGRVVGTQTISGTPLGSVFAVDVDAFRVGNPAYPNQPVFAISTVGGVANIAFNGNLYADGSIIARTIAAGTITADKLNVTSLSAINANLGTVTAGLIQNPAATLLFDLPNMRIYRADNTMQIDFSNKIIEMIF